MAKKKVKIASVLDLSEKEVEVDDGVHVELPLPPEAIMGRPSAKDEVIARVESLDMQLPTAEQERLWNEAMRTGPGIIQPLRREPRKLPEGMNKYNSTNEWLMLILESLYRIEAKLGA